METNALARFLGAGTGEPLYLPDLTLWYDWHRKQGTLPEQWQGFSLPHIAVALGVPAWLPVRPWRVESPGVKVKTTKQAGELVISSQAPSGTLTARWTVGPDGDWWQVEYPVKTAEDLPAALEIVQAREYTLDAGKLAEAEAGAAEETILALELPRRPYSDLLHEFLGWSMGLMLLGKPAVQEMLDVLEGKLQDIVSQVAELPGQILFSPDNLDGQFISPRAFKRLVGPSYQHTTDLLHDQGKVLVVHVGGPVRNLLQPLAQAGVDVIEGLAGAPQGNTTLAEAREIAGPAITLWGGIPQGYMEKAYDWPDFEAAVGRAIQEATGDDRIILGVADRVPVDAQVERLEAIPRLLRPG